MVSWQIVEVNSVMSMIWRQGESSGLYREEIWNEANDVAC